VTNALLAGLVAACLAIAAEGYFLIGRQQRLTDRLEQAADALERLLPMVPGKSAPRTGAAEESAVPEPAGMAREPAVRPQEPRRAPIRLPVPERTDTDAVEAVIDEQYRNLVRREIGGREFVFRQDPAEARTA
jgi:hypothetical protein